MAVDADELTGGASRTSPAAARALRVLETLAADPGRGLKLAELRRRLGFSHGNLHAILATMEAAGHVRRDVATRAYTLGPALLAIGEAARRTYPTVDTALPFMIELADELDTECHAGMRVGKEILIVARVGPDQPVGLGVTVGQRFPLTPPLGLAYIAWSTDADIEAYFGAASYLSDEEITRHRALAQAIRRQGFALHVEVDKRQAMAETSVRILAEATREGLEEELAELVHELGHQRYVLVDPPDAGDLRVIHLSGPVFGPDGSVALNVGVTIGDRPVPEVAARVLEVAAAITAALGGTSPL